MENTMYRKLITAISVLPLLTGCVIEVVDTSGGGSNGGGSSINFNDAPSIDWADAGCYWDSYNGDYVWWFEADVFDRDGFYDVDAVYADIYDARGYWVDGFELFQETPAPEIWFSDWLEFSTFLDCGYKGYTVEFTAFDVSDDFDTMEVVPYTYY
jgi:hypothetical protein